MSEDTSNTVYKLITDDLQLALITLRTICGAVYCNQSCLFVGGWVCVCLCGGGSVTTITRNCVHRSSPKWVYR